MTSVYQCAEWEAFVKNIRANPDEDTLRLVAADWLDEMGERDRAEVIRVQIQMPHVPHEPVASGLLSHGTGCVYGCKACALEGRERKLLMGDRYEDGVWVTVAAGVHFLIRRGFAEQMECPASVWFQQCGDITRREPLSHVLWTRFTVEDRATLMNQAVAVGMAASDMIGRLMSQIAEGVWDGITFNIKVGDIEPDVYDATEDPPA